MHTPRNIQAPNVEADFWANHGSITPRMCTLIKITSKFGDVVGLTSNTRDMTMPGHVGVTFKSTPGISPSMVEQALDEATNLEMNGIYQTGIFEQQDVINGIWNFAAVEVFTASWGNVNLGELVYMKGNLGEFKDYQTHFNAEGRGQMSRLANDVNECTSRFCRVDEFGDTKCGKSLAGTVTVGGVAYNITQSSIDGQPFSVGNPKMGAIFDTSAWSGNVPADPFPSAFFALYPNAKLTALDGPNAGVTREVAQITESTGGHPFVNIITKRPFPFAIEATTEFSLITGCARTLNDCMKYGNVVNRRAEDWIPGLEAVNRIPSGN